MSQRIADCIEVLDRLRLIARLAPMRPSSQWRREATEQVASRGVSSNTVFAHITGKDTSHTLTAYELDQLVSEWINGTSSSLESWLLRSSSTEEAQRIRTFFSSQDTTPLAIDIGEPKATIRQLVSTYRVLRDTALARRIKADMDYLCQICAFRIILSDGTAYAEAHHVKPLGEPHSGPDHPGNIVCVCPNCHVLLDYGAITADPSQLHNVAREFIDYHNTFIYRCRD